MGKFRNADDSSGFDASSYLTSQQVAYFFSRLASKRVFQANESEDEKDEHGEELNKIHEQNIQDLSNEVMVEYHCSIRSCTIRVTFAKSQLALN